MEKLCKLFKKNHFSIGLILLAYSSINLYNVFYITKSNIFDYKFNYFEPTLFISFFMGVIQTAMLSFGEEKNLFKVKEKDIGTSVFNRSMDIFGYFFFNILFISFSNILFEKFSFKKRYSISFFYFAIASIGLLLTIVCIIYSEYIIYKSLKEKSQISKKQLLTQGILYIIAIGMIVLIINVISPMYN